MPAGQLILRGALWVSGEPFPPGLWIQLVKPARAESMQQEHRGQAALVQSIVACAEKPLPYQEQWAIIGLPLDLEFKTS